MFYKVHMNNGPFRYFIIKHFQNKKIERKNILKLVKTYENKVKF
jgi:hypothetical protein